MQCTATLDGICLGAGGPGVSSFFRLPPLATYALPKGVYEHYLTLPYPHEDTHRLYSAATLYRNSAMPYAVARFRVYTRIPQANRTRFSVEILTPRAPEEPSHRCCFGWLASPLAGPRDAPAAVCFPSPTRAGARVVAAEMPSREEMVSREEMASRRSPKQREMPFRTRAAGPADS